MTLGELLEILIDLQKQHGSNVDVYSHNDMIADEPNPQFVKGTRYFSEGVYLN